MAERPLPRAPGQMSCFRKGSGCDAGAGSMVRFEWESVIRRHWRLQRGSSMSWWAARIDGGRCPGHFQALVGVRPRCGYPGMRPDGSPWQPAPEETSNATTSSRGAKSHPSEPRAHGSRELPTKIPVMLTILLQCDLSKVTRTECSHIYKTGRVLSENRRGVSTVTARSGDLYSLEPTAPSGF